MVPVVVVIRRGTDRFVQKATGRLTRHSFSFGSVYDPENLSFGPMVCHDDHLLSVGAGFEEHPHHDLDIVTWVLGGALTHTDSTGGSRTVGTGEVAVLRTGTGITHSEVAAAPQTRFVQVWLRADGAGEASYDVRPVELPVGEVVTVATVGDAVFEAVRLGAGDEVTLRSAPLQHVYVARGALGRSSLAEPLQEGDAFRFTDEPGHTLTATVPTELLVWSFASAGSQAMTDNAPGSTSTTTGG